MIIYETDYRNVFREVSADADTISVLNCISGISIDVVGTPANGDLRGGEPSACITKISVEGTPVVSCTFTLIVKIPVLWGDTEKTIEVKDGLFVDTTAGVMVTVDYNSTGLHSITLNEPAYVLMRSLHVNLQRSVKFNSEDGISVRSGYNVGVKYTRNTLAITGGSGLGKGRYKGSTDKHTSKYYKGIKTINGLRDSRNVDIEVSDLLASNGASVDDEA